MRSFCYEKEVTAQSCVEQDPDSFLFDYQSLAGIVGRFAEPAKSLEDLFRPFFFEFSHLLGLLNNFPGLVFRELLGFSPKTFNIATTAVTLPVFEVSIAILLALEISIANLVALIGWVSVDSKLGCSNL